MIAPSPNHRASFQQELLSPVGERPSDLKYVIQEQNEEDNYKKLSTQQKIWNGIFYTFLSIGSLYFFMVAIKLLGESFTLLLGCEAEGAFHFTNNPIAGLMIGTIATALLHSSGTVTSITVTIVGAGGMTIRQAVPIIMGANIGTCITCIMVAFGQVGDRLRFERAMAAATVHDMYNIWSVFVMFPIEILFHPLEKLSVAMSNSKTNSGSFKSPVDFIVNPLTKKILVTNTKLVTDAAAGLTSCDGKSLIKGGAFKGTSMSDDAVAAICLCIGITLLVCSLVSLVKMLAKVFLGPTKKIVAKILNYNGYINILVGTLITFAVHSSTVVTSTLTPMAGLNVITLEQVYPLVIGANLGTTGTALLASLVTGKPNSVAIALVHFWFNLLGIFLFFPIPITRKPILSWARKLAFFSAAWPPSAIIFLCILFLVGPGILLGFVYMCGSPNTAVVVFGWIFVAVCVLGMGFFGFWYIKKGGRQMWYDFLEKKRTERELKENEEEKKSMMNESAV
jgi:sodium-dependent phosphate cotransporter